MKVSQRLALLPEMTRWIRIDSNVEPQQSDAVGLEAFIAQRRIPRPRG